MNVGDFFRNLSYGELSNLSMANSGDGTIRAEDQSRVIHYTNQALTRLYVRFAHNRNYGN